VRATCNDLTAPGRSPLLIADDATAVVVDPAAAEAHLSAPRWQRPASDWAALDLSAAGAEAIGGFLAPRGAELRVRGARDRDKGTHARK
jgi:hypothetical protein